MSPRKYDMSKRAAAAAQTRRRIVDATRQLHTEQGIAATSWDDIAARAGVGVGTVYRHFPTLDELVPACGEASMEIVALPAPAEAPGLFEGLSTPAQRIAKLVQEVFAIYERGAPELRVARNEPAAHESVAAFHAEIEASLEALTEAALSPLDVPPQERALVRAMLDLGTWEAMRGAGLDAPGAAAAASEMLAARPIAR
jgi:AcrR family transcriptional regulator